MIAHKKAGPKKYFIYVAVILLSRIFLIECSPRKGSNVNNV